MLKDCGHQNFDVTVFLPDLVEEVALIFCFLVMRFRVLLLSISFFDWLGSKWSMVFLLYSHFSLEKFLSNVIDLRAPLGVFDLSRSGLVWLRKLGAKLLGVHLIVVVLALTVYPAAFLIGLSVPLSWFLMYLSITSS